MRGSQMKGRVSAPMTEGSVQALREEFDLGFRQPRVTAIDDVEPLLLIDTAESRLAVRVSELGGVHPCPALTHVPAPYHAQAGLAGINSRLVMAFRLSAFVAHDRVPRSGRWIALSAEDRSIGFVFDAIAGYVQVPKEEIHRRADGDERHASAEVIRFGGAVRSVLQLPVIMMEIRARLAQANESWSS